MPEFSIPAALAAAPLAAAPEQQQQEEEDEELIDWEEADAPPPPAQPAADPGAAPGPPQQPEAPPPPPRVADTEMSIEELEGCDFLPASTETALNTYKLSPEAQDRLRGYERKWPGVLTRSGCPLCNNTFSSTSEFMVRYTALLKDPLLVCPPTVRYREIETLYRQLVTERMSLAGSEDAVTMIPWTFELIHHHFTHHCVVPPFVGYEVTEKLVQVWRVLYSRSLARIQVQAPGSDPRCTEADCKMIKLWLDISTKLESSLKNMAAGEGGAKRGSSLTTEAAGVKIQ